MSDAAFMEMVLVPVYEDANRSFSSIEMIYLSTPG
jgi:hypothetical protein